MSTRHIILPAYVTEDDILQKIKELYAGEYSPYTPENLYEAIGNIPGSLEDRISEAMKAKDDAAVGYLLRDATEAYWWNRSSEAAPGIIKDEIDSARFERGLAELEARRVA